MLNIKEKEFLKRRNSFTASWSIVATIIIAVLVIILLWMFIESPYLANPMYVSKTLKEGSFDESTMVLSALILPIMIWLIFSSIIIFILYGFAIISNEKKYLAIINKLQK